MNKKTKITIAFSFLLFVFPFVTSAGCFGPYLIIDSNNINLNCFNVESNPCYESISIYNNCKENFLYFTNSSTNSIVNKNNDENFVSTAERLVYPNYIEIPPNWGLVFDYNNKKNIEFCKFDENKPKSTKPDCLLIPSAINLDNFLMKFEANSKQYTIKGHFDANGKIINNKNTNIPLIISTISAFLFIFLLTCFIVSKYKTKKKK